MRIARFRSYLHRFRFATPRLLTATELPVDVRVVSSARTPRNSLGREDLAGALPPL
jgi:hypothetical protein